MSWSLEKETALGNLLKEGVPYAEALEALSDVPDEYLLTAAAQLRAKRWQGVHTCHADCPCHTGGKPLPDFVEPEDG